MRKFTLVLITILVVALLTFQSQEVKTNSGVPPSARTGAPDELTCGDGSLCHNTVPNTFDGSVAITFSDPDSHYVPGNTYSLTVTVTDLVQSKFGFELTSLDGSNLQAGSFVETSTNISLLTGIVSGDTRNYAAHFIASSSNTFNFDWTAPIADAGPVTFYAAGNAANNSGTNFGDHIYTTSLTVNPLTSAIADVTDETNKFFILENPISDKLNIGYELHTNKRTSIRLYNLSGQLVRSLYDGYETTGSHTHSFALDEVKAGLYLVYFHSGDDHHAEKIIVQ